VRIALSSLNKQFIGVTCSNINSKSLKFFKIVKNCLIVFYGEAILHVASSNVYVTALPLKYDSFLIKNFDTEQPNKYD